jgi:hypothetical protein
MVTRDIFFSQRRAIPNFPLTFVDIASTRVYLEQQNHLQSFFFLIKT